MNFIDQFIGYFNPRAGAQRLRDRGLMNFFEKNRAYDAAGVGRRTKNWRANNVSANVEIEGSLEKLRARSRELDRNNPYAKRAVERIADNVIGTGIRPTPAKETKKLKEAWKLWAEKKECDFDGLMSFYGLQRLAMRTVAESGECIVRMRRTTENKKSMIPIQLQIFEPDIIDSGRNLTVISGSGEKNKGGFVIQGVEFNSDGKRIGYWLWDRYPSEHVVTTSLVSKFVPAEEIIHVYLVERPGQVRGVPFGVSAFLRLKDFDEYEDAELVRQKIAACFTAFITESLDSAQSGTTSKSNVTEKFEPGLISRMNPGEEVSFSNPPTKEGIDDYSRQILQGIAAGYGMSYEALTGDMRNVNFSSGRMGWLEFQRQISNWQNNMFITMFCETVWEWFLKGAQISNIIPAKGDFSADWVPPRREMIDPSKEIEALNAAVRAGFQDWGEAVTELGGDPETVLDRIQKYNGEFDKRGIILDSDPRKTAVGGKVQQIKEAGEEGSSQKPKKKIK